MINLRIKEVRKVLNLSQKDFAKRIGVTQPSLSDMENGRTINIDNRNIKLICQEFNVNEEWLRTGQGEMFNTKNENILIDLLQKHNLDELDRRILLSYINLNASQRKVIKDFIKSIVKGSNTNEEPNN